MRSLFAITIILLSLSATSFSAAACSANGKFCDSPKWAADAFTKGGGR